MSTWNEGAGWMAPRVWAGCWVTLEPLGKGGQANTYLVRRVDGPEDAVFVLKKLNDKRRIRRFETEIQTLLRLDHPNIVKIVDSDLHAAEPFLVMEYCSGGTLERYPELQYSSGQTFRTFLTICEAVAYLHANRIVHRDVKPANVFLRADTTVPVVGDVGICFITNEDGERLTSTDRVVGARYYLPPEAAMGRLEDVRPTFDVYSLGKVLYWMLSGKIFDREDHHQPEFNILTWPNLPLDYYYAYQIFDQSIVRNPDSRYADAKTMATDIKRIISMIEIGAHILDLKTPQPCGYCGEGYYKPIVDFNGQSGSIELQEFGFQPRVTDNWLILVCDNCGNVQFFRTDYTKKRAWNGRRDR
jgi:serine/threonine protein kinase